jgi:hypothetical protein
LLREKRTGEGKNRDGSSWHTLPISKYKANMNQLYREKKEFERGKCKAMSMHQLKRERGEQTTAKNVFLLLLYITFTTLSLSSSPPPQG